MKKSPANLGVVGRDLACSHDIAISQWRPTAQYIHTAPNNTADPTPPYGFGDSSHGYGNKLANVAIPGSHDGYVAAWLLICASIGVVLAGILNFAGRNLV